MFTTHTLKEFFNESFSRFSERPAVTCLGHTLNYNELNELSDNFAVYLHYNLGLKPGDKIAILLPNILQYPVIVMAAIKAGIVIVNTNPLYTSKELMHQLNDANVKVIVLLSSLSGNLLNILPETPLQYVIVTRAGDLLPPVKRFFLNTLLKLKEYFSAQVKLDSGINFLTALTTGKANSSAPVPRFNITPDSLALLQYTGGTTGISKGAMLSHQNLLSNIQQVNASLEGSLVEGQEIIIAPLPLYHIFCFMVCLLFGFGIGAHIILIPDPRKTHTLITSIKGIPFTFFVGLNTLFNNLCRHKKFQQLDFSHLKITISGGMALLHKTALSWQSITHCKIIEGYGLTEASPVVTLNPYYAPQLGTVGKPLINTQCRFIDAKGIDVKPGQPGELLIRGPQIMTGYWQRPEATSATIDSAGWLHTGDVAVENIDGYLSIVDRIKDMIVISGFNVYPTELEQEISQHPDIVECAAIGVADPETLEAVKLFVVTNNPILTAKDIQAFARRTLCPYKVPKYIEFLNELPKSNVGKVLRRKLRH